MNDRWSPERVNASEALTRIWFGIDRAEEAAAKLRGGYTDCLELGAALESIRSAQIEVNKWLMEVREVAGEVEASDE